MSSSKPENTITWDANGEPHSTLFDDVYFSNEQGLAESRAVFLHNNDLQTRFHNLHSHQHFTVGETGFGTGLNFLTCWQLWLQEAPAKARLSYLSVEKYPLSPDDLEQALGLWPELDDLSQQLLNQYRLNYIGDSPNHWQCFAFGQVRLILIIGEAEQGLQSLAAANHPESCFPGRQVDAWFLDGFAPVKNPQMWSLKLLNTLAKLSGIGTSFATFTAAGSVRRHLMSAGFKVEKTPGFGHKREMLRGQFIGSVEAGYSFNNSKTPWSIPSNFTPTLPQQTVAVIGAGLAGCHCAFALAKRDFNVTLIDRHHNLARGTSGNPQGVVYAKLSPHPGSLGDFNLQALLFAQNFYRQFWRQSKTHGSACGVLQLDYDERSHKNNRQLAELLADSSIATYLDAKASSEIANVPLNHGGLYFPHCGWLAPAQLCHWLSAQKGIEFLGNTQIKSIVRENKQWLLQGKQCADTDWSQKYDAVVIASANEAKTFNQTEWLPTKAVRGQISYLDQQPKFTLDTVICGDGYLSPCGELMDGQCGYTAGASFNVNELSAVINPQDHQENIDRLRPYFAEPKLNTIIGGRVGFRCTSPDYLPLSGPVADYTQFLQRYAGLRHNAKAVIPEPGCYLPHCFLLTALGSRGLVYAPIAAELIASQLMGEAPPLSQALSDALNPSRFLIRGLIRRKL